MRVHFTDQGWEDYRHWAAENADSLQRINDLIEEIRRTPFTGTGKPEPLKGLWSRLVTKEHRLVYAVEGKGADQRVTVLQCRYHY